MQIFLVDFRSTREPCVRIELHGTFQVVSVRNGLDLQPAFRLNEHCWQAGNVLPAMFSGEGG